MKLRHGNGRKTLSHGTRSASKCTVTNRYETFRCQACGRGVKRKSRQQRFCSDRCRNYAHRNAPSQINGRTAIKSASGYRRHEPPFFIKQKQWAARAKIGGEHPAKRAWRLSLAQCRRCRPRAVAEDCQSRDRGHPMTGNEFLFSPNGFASEISSVFQMDIE